MHSIGYEVPLAIVPVSAKINAQAVYMLIDTFLFDSIQAVVY